MSQTRTMKADEIKNFKEKRDQIKFYEDKMTGTKLTIDKHVSIYNELEIELQLIKDLPLEKPEPVVEKVLEEITEETIADIPVIKEPSKKELLKQLEEIKKQIVGFEE